MNSLTRSKIRYICFRLQSEKVRGVILDKEGVLTYALDIKEHMEEQDYFGGWEKFGKTWDVDEKAPLVVVPLKKSLESEWNATLKKNAKLLPSLADKDSTLWAQK